MWFSSQVNTFHVVLGGDGAPFGKDETACSFLASFLNRGKHIKQHRKLPYFWCKLWRNINCSSTIC